VHKGVAVGAMVVVFADIPVWKREQAIIITSQLRRWLCRVKSEADTSNEYNPKRVGVLG